MDTLTNTLLNVFDSLLQAHADNIFWAEHYSTMFALSNEERYAIKCDYHREKAKKIEKELKHAYKRALTMQCPVSGVNQKSH